jgi:uncharacterized OB-fold protein
VNRFLQRLVDAFVGHRCPRCGKWKPQEFRFCASCQKEEDGRYV